MHSFYRKRPNQRLLPCYWKKKRLKNPSSPWIHCKISMVEICLLGNKSQWKCCIQQMYPFNSEEKEDKATYENVKRRMLRVQVVVLRQKILNSFLSLLNRVGSTIMVNHRDINSRTHMVLHLQHHSILLVIQGGGEAVQVLLLGLIQSSGIGFR